MNKLRALLFGLTLFSSAGLQAADEPVTLKYTYRPETAQVTVLHDIQGKTYLPLSDVAQFYGIQVAFDSQTRRVTLSKGKSQVKLVLSQPVFMTVNPEGSFPIDPVEVISGQLGILPGSAEDIFSEMLSVSVRFLPESQSLVAGKIPPDELKKEIQVEAQLVKKIESLPTPTPASSAPTTEAEEDKDDEQAQPLPPPVREENSPAENQVYRVRRIIIDPGHGGRDVGAKGFDKKYCEKQATLDIAKRVAEILKEDPNLEVYMTRTSDYYITLKYRCEFANRHNGDVFVSIHCNSNPKSKTTGTETYVYSPRASNRYAAVAAVRENGHTDYLESIKASLHQDTYKSHSFKLAEEVVGLIRNRMKQHIRYIQHAPFYVLRQVDMPSILVETAFISNPKEEVKLRDPYWRDNIAKSIADGILSFRDIVESTSENQQARR
jgi:N-acetylmuramoyl-L-alanine amidase